MITLRVKVNEDLTAEAERIIKESLNEPMKKRMDYCGRAIVQRAAKDLAPVDTGRLRNSIKYETKENGDRLESSIFTNVEYAPYQEFGTGSQGNAEGVEGITFGPGKGIPPHPFMYPALKNNEDKIIEYLGRRIKKQ